MNVLALCAGVGGLELGIRIAEPRARGICYVEREAYAASILAARMENGWLHKAPIWSDLGTFDPEPWSGVVDCITSGDPCQPNSLAGKQLGKDDDRWLLVRVLSIVEAIRPRRFFRENVPGNADGQLEALITALEGMGYRIAAGIFSAEEVGASHRRERLFIMADRQGDAGGITATARADPNKPVMNLQGAARRWPTATARDHKGANAADHLENGMGRKHMDQLPNYVAHLWYTPNVPNGGRVMGDAATETGILPAGTKRQVGLENQTRKFQGDCPSSPLAPPIPDGRKSSATTRRLSPLFVEWLMGWTIGWTGCAPLETASFQWLPLMRGYLWMLYSAPDDPAQSDLFG